MRGKGELRYLLPGQCVFRLFCGYLAKGLGRRIWFVHGCAGGGA